MLQPKAWTELQAGLECLTQLLALIDSMQVHYASLSSSLDTKQDSDLAEAASALRKQLVYNGEVLDVSLDALKSYREGTQSLKYLDASVRLAYELLRMLERWGKERSGGEMLVRKKMRKRRKGRGAGGGEGEDEESGLVQEEEESEDEVIEQEMIFTFDSFEAVSVHNPFFKPLSISYFLPTIAFRPL